MATFLSGSLITTCSAQSRGDISGQLMVLDLALAPMTSWQSATASCKLWKMWACARISSAPQALDVASALGKILGATSRSLVMFMFFMARATAPIFPGCVVSTRTIFICDSNGVVPRLKISQVYQNICYHCAFYRSLKIRLCNPC